MAVIGKVALLTSGTLALPALVETSPVDTPASCSAVIASPEDPKKPLLD